jgi:hypothetical protein
MPEETTSLCAGSGPLGGVGPLDGVGRNLGAGEDRVLLSGSSFWPARSWCGRLA